MLRKITAFFSDIYRVIWGAIIVLIITFVWSSWQDLNQETSLQFLSFKFTYPLRMWLFGFFMGGILIAYIHGFIIRAGHKKTIRRSNKELKSLKQELDEMRNQGITEEIAPVKSVTPPVESEEE